MGDVHYIIDKLKEQPFNVDISLLAFSEKTPQELLQLLSNVFAAISPKHQKVDVSREDPEQTAERLDRFLRTVKYKPTLDALSFRQALAAGDKDAVYTILKWVLPQPQMLQKRAFVGHYLSLPDMPEELNYDPEVADLKEEIKGLQATFIAVHKESDAAQASTKDLTTLRGRIKGLEEEKERLAEKVERAKAQAARLPDMNDYMGICQGLRKELDDEVAISQQLQSQHQQLERSEGAYQRAAARLRELQSSSGDASGAKLLEAMQENVARLRAQVNERYPKEMERKQKRLQSVQEALSNGINTEMDLQRLSAQVASLQQQTAAITERKAAADKARQGDRAYLQVRQAAQMAALVAKKRDELAAKLERLTEKRDGLTERFEKAVAASTDSGAGTSAPAAVSEEEWRAKYESMRAQLPAYKAMKKELGAVEAEALVLGRTLELLGQQERALSGAVEKMEHKQGIQGFSDVAADLEKVSEAKSALDEAKGSVLTQISSTVEQIAAAIKKRKAALAPQITQLRGVRDKFTELETRHTEKKAAYDAAVGALEARVAALEEETGSMSREVAEGEAKAAALADTLNRLDTNLKRVATAASAERLREQHQQDVAEREAELRALKEQQRAVRDMHASGLQQMDMMADLMKLMQLKLELMRGGGGSSSGGRCYEGAAEAGMFGAPAANVFVL